MSQKDIPESMKNGEEDIDMLDAKLDCESKGYIRKEIYLGIQLLYYSINVETSENVDLSTINLLENDVDTYW